MLTDLIAETLLCLPGLNTLHIVWEHHRRSAEHGCKGDWCNCTGSWSQRGLSVFREFSCFLSPSLIHIACEDVKETAFTPFPSLFFLFWPDAYQMTLNYVNTFILKKETFFFLSRIRIVLLGNPFSKLSINFQNLQGAKSRLCLLCLMQYLATIES